MKEIIERMSKFIDSILSFFIYFLLGFLAVGGFLYGSSALTFIFIEKGVSPYPILMSFKLLGFFFAIVILILIIKLLFLLIKKLIPILEESSSKQKEKGKKEFVKVIREAVREELKSKSTKNRKRAS